MVHCWTGVAVALSVLISNVMLLASAARAQ
jgi:hypothetical protein